MNTFDLSRNWFNFCFENPELITPTHTAIYFFAIEHCNRLGGKEKFGFPSQMTMDAIGIRKHQTYIRYFNDIVDWGFFKLIEKSKNQYSSNIISLVYAMPKKDKALDKAMVNHAAKQGQSTRQSKDSIDKQQTTNNKQENDTRSVLEKFGEELKKHTEYDRDMLIAFYNYWTEPDKKGKLRFEFEKNVVNGRTFSNMEK